MMLKLLVTMALISAASVAGKSDDATTCSASADLTCDAGFSLEAGTCTACVPATASVCGNGKAPKTAAQACVAGNAVAYTTSTAASGSDCVACAAGKFAATSGDGCTAGPPNSATCASATVCSTCNAGFSLESSGHCEACVPAIASVCGNGKEPKTAADVCTQGNSAAYTTGTASGSSDCAVCADGKFPAANSADGCTACRANAATCDSLTVDKKCNAGFSLETASGPATCTACALPAASVCAAGKEPTTAAIVCIQDNAAAYTTQTSATGAGCAACAAGKFAATSGVGCSACRTNAASCTSLTVDSTCNAGFSLESTTCTACELPAASVCGNGKAPTNANVVCTQDNAAAYTTQTSPTGSGCADCAAGKFAAANGADGCTECAGQSSAGSALQINALLSAATLLVALRRQ